MALDHRTRKQLLAHCGEIHEDDGIDPLEFFREGRGRGRNDRKAKQLCRQVAETLDQVLSGETGDDVLRGLRVCDVVPAPDSSRLLVTLHADCERAVLDRNLVEQRLAAVRGWLRCAVAAAITRRKTPTLMFNIIGPAGPETTQEQEAVLE